MNDDEVVYPLFYLRHKDLKIQLNQSPNFIIIRFAIIAVFRYNPLRRTFFSIMSSWLLR